MSGLSQICIRGTFQTIEPIILDNIRQIGAKKAELPKLTIPTLTIGGAFDTMDPEHKKWTSTSVKKWPLPELPQWQPHEYV